MLETLGPVPLDGAWQALEIRHFPACCHGEYGRSRSNRTSVLPPENFVPLILVFGVTLGHRNPHGSIGYLCLPVSDLK